METQKRVLIVLGIARSGTSAITKALEVLGVTLPEQSQVSFNKFNEKGYWEDQDFFFFNLELLRALGPLENRRRNILMLCEQEVSFLCEQGFLEKASQLVLQKTRGAAPIALKGATFSTLLPFWKKVFLELNIEASFVIALRNPYHVAASIQASQEIIGKQDDEKSFWIWISYMLIFSEQTRGYQRLFVDYEELLKNPGAQIERMARVFQWNPQAALQQNYIHEFIDRSLCHFHDNEKESGGKEYQQIFAMEIYKTLSKIAKEEVPLESLEKEPLFEQWKAQFLSAESLLILVEKIAYEARSFKELLLERERLISTLQEQMTQHTHSLAESYKTLHQRNLQMAEWLFKRNFKESESVL